MPYFTFLHVYHNTRIPLQFTKWCCCGGDRWVFTRMLLRVAISRLNTVTYQRPTCSVFWPYSALQVVLVGFDLKASEKPILVNNNNNIKLHYKQSIYTLDPIPYKTMLLFYILTIYGNMKMFPGFLHFCISDCSRKTI